MIDMKADSFSDALGGSFSHGVYRIRHLDQNVSFPLYLWDGPWSTRIAP